ncbi:WxL domain-containing protein [Candidatus Enterococcus murrayae]|uniref:WxL domain-containing protein n=1 Tax=Candidatus Enterococcus murrayae TaxID=2815321 RepID=A0ABS3HLA4_9ENTE|nr:WxL domain-containing protein [Enterococcus sp. MJM16]MBO0453690.1 WxL domain-containing protein [Enterococcus sp. MJM16]
MNKKKLVTGLLSTAFLGGVLVTTALPADAATFSEKSTGSVTFKEGTLINPPTTDPDIDPGPDNGKIGLLYVPTEFIFEDTAVPTSVVTTTTVIPIAPTLSNPLTKRVAVGDVRGKRAAGWKLEAKLDAELTTGSKNLTAATITMTQGLKTLDPVTGVATTEAPTVHTPDTVTGSLTISPSSSLVMSASGESAPNKADGRGEGYWQGELTSINLNVPAGAMNLVAAGEQYSGTIDWTLTDSI